MARPTVPPSLARRPFRAKDAVEGGLLTRRQLQGKAWVRLLPGVYAQADHKLSYRDRCVAASLYVGERGVLSGLSAAVMWRADLEPAQVEVTVPTEARLRSRPGLVVVRSPLPAGDVSELPTARGGLRLTSPARTAFDLARRLGFTDAVIAVDAMLNAAVLGVDDVAAVARCRPGWPGIEMVPRVLAAAEPEAESPMETRLRLIIVGGGLPRPVAQVDVSDERGRFIGRLDLAYRKQRVGIEYEGDRHRGRAAFQADLRRFNRLRGAGWTVLRYGPRDVFDRPDGIVADVRRALGLDGGDG